jgi:hypothetical protein
MHVLLSQPIEHLVLVLEFLIIDIHELDQLNGVGLGNTEIAQKLE